MASKKKKLAVFGITFLVVALIFLQTQFGIFGFLNNIFAIPGFQTLSLSQVQFTSNDPSIGGQVWLLVVSQNGAGQSAYGQFIAMDSGKDSNSFTITTNLDKNYATYNINNQGINIKHIDHTSTIYNPFSSTGGCNPDYWDAYIKAPGSLTVYCYKYTNDGQYGTVGSANINFQSTISVQGSGGSDSCVISNVGANSCVSKNGNVLVSWAGNLVSGQSPPQASDQGIIAIYDTAKGGWKTGNYNSYLRWYNYNANGFANCISYNGGDSCFNTYNNYESQLMQGYSFTSTGGNVATTTGTLSSGQIIMNLGTQVQFPVLSMKIKASLIGINIPVGKPKIISVSSQTFQTGQNGVVQVTIQNVGDGAGSFSVYASCDNQFSQNGNSLTISSLTPNSQQTVYIPITANVVSGTSSGTCTVTAKDINNPNNVDIKTVSVSSNAIAICESGSTRISGNNIQQCTNNIWTNIRNCGSNQTAQYKNGVPDCVSQNEISNNGFFGAIGSFFKTLFSPIVNLFNGILNWFSIVKLTFVFLVLILGTLFSREFFESFKSIRKSNLLVWILAIVVGGAFAYLVYLVFWIGIILFVIFLIVKAVISGVFLKFKVGLR